MDGLQLLFTFYVVLGRLVIPDFSLNHQNLQTASQAKHQRIHTSSITATLPDHIHLHALLTKWSDFGCEKSIPIISRHRAATRPKTHHQKLSVLLLHPISQNPQLSASKLPIPIA